MDAGYAADIKELTSSTGVAAFLAPVGLGWQVVNDLVDAARAGSAKASRSAVAVLAQSQHAGQSASVGSNGTPARSPAGHLGVSLQVCALWHVDLRPVVLRAEEEADMCMISFMVGAVNMITLCLA